MTKFIKKNQEILLQVFFVVLLLLISSFLRFRSIGKLTVFQYDQARDALYIKRLLVDHKFRIIGPQSSSGLYYGPAYYYLMAPFLLLSELNPSGLDFGVAVFGVISVVLLYVLLKKITENSLISFTACLLYATQPIVVYQSRYSWNPNITPFFSILFFLGLDYCRKKQNIGWLLSLVGLGFLLNLHYPAFCLLPVIIFFMWKYKQSLRSKWFLISTLIFLFLISPFIAMETRHNFLNLRAAYNIFKVGPQIDLPPPSFVVGIWQKVKTLLVGIPLTTDNLFISIVAVAMILILLIYFFVKRNDFKEKNFPVFLSLFFLCLIGSFFKGSYFSYYLTFLYPIGFLILSLILTNVFERRGRAFYVIFLLSFFIIRKNILADFNLLKQNSTLDNLLEVSAIIESDIKTGDVFNLVGIRGGDRFDHNAVDYRYFLETFYNKRSKDWDVLDYQESKNLYLVDTLGGIDPINTNIWEVKLFKPKKIINKWTASDGTIIYKLVN